MKENYDFQQQLFYEIFTEDASQLFLYHGAKKSKMTKNSNQGGGGLTCRIVNRFDVLPDTLY